MSRFNTGNPLGSGDPRDLDDNAKNMDLAVNSDAPQWVDRFGRPRLPLMEQERRFIADQERREGEFDSAQEQREDAFDAAQDSRETRFNDFIAASGYQFVGDYGPSIEITEYNQLIRDANGEFWRVSGQVDLPYVTTGAGIPEDDALVPAGDAVLRQDLANPDKGAAMVARGAVAVDSIADLLALPEGQRKQGLRYLVKGFYSGSTVGGGLFSWNPSMDKSAADGGTIIDPAAAAAYGVTAEDIADYLGDQGTGAGHGCFVKSLDGPLSPLEFGFVSGASLDGQSTYILRSLSEAARKLNRSISYEGIDEIVLRRRNPTVAVPIWTSVDFAGATLTIEDGIVQNLNRYGEPPEGDGGKPNFFVIGRPYAPVDLPLMPGDLTKGSTYVRGSDGENLPNGFHVFHDPDSLLPPRVFMGELLPPETLLFPVNIQSGRLSSGLPLNMSSSAFARYYGDPAAIEVRNLKVNTESFNSATVILCQRSNAQISGITDSSGMPVEHQYVSYLTLSRCGNVRIEGVRLPQQMVDSDKISGSYVVSMSEVADITFDNLMGIGDDETWGAFGSNHTTNITLVNSKVGRFDVHSGMFGSTLISNSSIIGHDIRYGWGAGSLIVRDSAFYDVDRLVGVRGDYWGQFDGSIHLEGIRVRFRKGAALKVFFDASSGLNNNLGDRDTIILCNDLTIENIEIFDSEPNAGSQSVQPFFFNAAQYEASNNVILPSKITIDDVKFSNSDGMYLSIVAPPCGFTTQTGGFDVNVWDVTNNHAHDGVRTVSEMLHVSATNALTPTESPRTTYNLFNCHNICGVISQQNGAVDITVNCHACSGAEISVSGSSVGVATHHYDCRYNTIPSRSSTRYSYGSVTSSFRGCEFEVPPDEDAEVLIRGARAMGTWIAPDVNLYSSSTRTSREDWFYGFSADLP